LVAVVLDQQVLLLLAHQVAIAFSVPLLHPVAVAVALTLVEPVPAVVRVVAAWGVVLVVLEHPAKEIPVELVTFTAAAFLTAAAAAVLVQLETTLQPQMLEMVGLDLHQALPVRQ
jgi:hypothetical protein